MGTADRGDLTALLDEVRAGRPDARDRLVDAIYGELRRIAGGLMRRERPDHTPPPGAWVHEALLRLVRGEALIEAPDRRYLFAAAAQAMRQVLVVHARGHRAGKRRGSHVRVPLDDALDSFNERGLDVIALHEALG